MAVQVLRAALSLCNHCKSNGVKRKSLYTRQQIYCKSAHTYTALNFFSYSSHGNKTLEWRGWWVEYMLAWKNTASSLGNRIHPQSGQEWWTADHIFYFSTFFFKFSNVNDTSFQLTRGIISFVPIFFRRAFFFSYFSVQIESIAGAWVVRGHCSDSSTK